MSSSSGLLLLAPSSVAATVGRKRPRTCISSSSKCSSSFSSNNDAKSSLSAAVMPPLWWLLLLLPQLASAAAATIQDDLHVPALINGNERRRLTSAVCPTCPNLARSCSAAFANANLGDPACPTEQSSAYQHSNGGGEWLAVDGNTNQLWGDGSVTHTIGGSAPGWWRVNLESPHNKIEEVVIYGRDGCCYERLYNLRMDILDSSGTVVATRFGPQNSVPTGVIFRFDLSSDDVVGKSVKVTNFNEALSLAEVQVYGHVTSTVCPTCPNLARSCSAAFANAALGAPACPAEQSSDAYTDRGFAEAAVDGNTNQIWGDGSVTHTKSLAEQGSGDSVWWRVDLEAPYNKIEEVVIYGRSDCNGCPERLYNLRMDILDTSGAAVATRFGPENPDQTDPANVIFHFDLSTDVIVGKSIKVTGNDSPLSLAEVQVYGQAVSTCAADSSITIQAEDRCSSFPNECSGVWIDVDGYVKGFRNNGIITAGPFNLAGYGTDVILDYRYSKHNGKVGSIDVAVESSPEAGTYISVGTVLVDTDNTWSTGSWSTARTKSIRLDLSGLGVDLANEAGVKFRFSGYSASTDGSPLLWLDYFTISCPSIDECDPDPCANGVCVDGPYSYSCDCPSGYDGEQCQIEPSGVCSIGSVAKVEAEALCDRDTCYSTGLLFSHSACDGDCKGIGVGSDLVIGSFDAGDYITVGPFDLRGFEPTAAERPLVLSYRYSRGSDSTAGAINVAVETSAGAYTHVHSFTTANTGGWGIYQIVSLSLDLSAITLADPGAVKLRFSGTSGSGAWNIDYFEIFCPNTVDECGSSPCSNGACTDGINSYSCQCDAGWTGPTCDISVPSCPTGGTCSNLARSCGAEGTEACPTSQSSVYIPADGLVRSPSIGNDGKYADSSDPRKAIFHTDNNSTDEYWRVDFDSNYNIIEQVIVYNVDGASQSRMNGAILQVLDFQDAVVASQTLDSDLIQSYTFVDTIGASVRLTHSNQFLHAREVEVYGMAITNSPSDQPSTSTVPSVVPSGSPSSDPSTVPSISPSVTVSASPSTSTSPSSLPSSTPSSPPTESPCSSNPCQNGATCINGPNGIGFSCQCTQGFSGSTCGIYGGETTTLSEAQAATTGAESVLNGYYDASWNYKVAQHDLDVVTQQCNDANVTYTKSQAVVAKLTNDYDQAVLFAKKMEQEYNLALGRSSTPAERGRFRTKAEDDWATAKQDMSAAEEAMNSAIDTHSPAQSTMNSVCDTSEDCSAYGGSTCMGKVDKTLSSADSSYSLARSSIESEPLISGRSSVFGFRSSFPLINPATLDFVYDDNDGDLVPNRFDACPTQKGLRRNSPTNPGPQDFCPSGCPEMDINGNVLDSDGDNIPDCEDRCPFDAGIDYNHGWTDGELPTNADRDPDLDFKGCPDRDNDGIPDEFDACPDQAGGACYSGCPNTKGVGYDTDRDGVPDCADRCPSAYNVGTTDGCPDLDMDGTPDSRDYCIATPGSSSFSFQRKLEGSAEKALNILGCPDSDADLVPNPADLCDAPAFPNQGPIVDGVARSGDAVVDKSGCPLDNDGDQVYDGIDKCDATEHSPDNTEHDTRAIVYFPGDDDATNDVLGCPRDTDNDGFVDGIDQCVSEGGLIGPDGCPVDSDQDGVSDCVSTDPNSDCHSLTSLPDASCCSEKDVCTDTPRGATVNATGCPSDDDNDNVANGLDVCPHTTQPELNLANSDSSKMSIDMKGCAILAASMWEPIFVDATIVDGNSANPGIELLFTVDADLPQVLASRQYNIASEMIQVRIMDENCQNTFDDQTIDVDKLLPLTVTVNDENPAFTGQIPFGSLPITIDIDLNPDGVVGSPIWSSSPPFDVGNIEFCLSVAILSDTLEPVTVKELKTSILVDMSQDFSVVETDIQRADAVKTTEFIDIEYSLNACQCDATNTCVDNNLIDDSFLRQSDSLRLCVSFAEDGGFLPPNYVQMTDVRTFSCYQGGLTITPISNFERQGNGGQLTAITPINNAPSEGQNYGPNDRMLVIDTRLPAKFFGPEERPVDCFGTILYEFNEGSSIGDPIATGGRQLRLAAKTSTPPTSPGHAHRRNAEAGGESQSEFSVKIMLGKASGGGRGNAGLIAGLTTAVVIIGASVLILTMKRRSATSIRLRKKGALDDSSHRPARAAPGATFSEHTRRQTIAMTDDGSVSTFADSTSGPPPVKGWVA